MGQHQLRRIPVVDAGGRLSGIIAQADVATRLAQPSTTGAVVEAISEPGSSAR
jgi:CBS domain-containing protein